VLPGLGVAAGRVLGGPPPPTLTSPSRASLASSCRRPAPRAADPACAAAPLSASLNGRRLALSVATRNDTAPTASITATGASASPSAAASTALHTSSSSSDAPEAAQEPPQPLPPAPAASASLRLGGLRLDVWSALQSTLCLTLAPPCAGLAALCGGVSAAGQPYCLLSLQERRPQAAHCCATCQVVAGVETPLGLCMGVCVWVYSV
jgi:hypothetical protein